MDLSDPTRSVTPTLDGPALAVLAAAGRPLTVGEVAAQAVRGSEIGIRRTLKRLVDQGLVTATMMGRNAVHELNRDHIAAGIAEGLASLRNELWDRLRTDLASWQTRPVYACVFGSAARGDGTPESDIDVLLVHPPLPGDPPITPSDRTMLASIDDLVMDAAHRARDPDQWHNQLDTLRIRVQRWTGNMCQVVDISMSQWRRPTPELQPLLAEIAVDGIDLAGTQTFPRKHRVS